MKRILLFALLLVSCGTVRPRPVERPNILFLFADDQRPDAVGAFGNVHVRTPTLDVLAREGFRFRRTYCMGSTRGAVCQPSRAMLMSGRTLYHVGMRLKGVTTLGEALRKNGYMTFGTGKWHNGEASFLRSFEKGRAVFLGGMSDHTRVPVRDVGPDGGFTKVARGKKFSSELFADAAIDFLQSHDGTKPYFCYVAFTSPHDPRQPPKGFREKSYAKKPPLPANFMPQHPFHNGWMTGRDEALAAWPRTPEVIRDQLAEYYGMIAHMDGQIARILKAGGPETIVIYSADHGLALGSHGLLGKQNLYEHSMGAPLLVRGPGIPKGSSDALTYLHDLMPTICDLTGTKIPDGVEGRSLRPIWEGKIESNRRTLFTTYENKMRAVRDDRWKLIVYPQIHHRQLFDLQNDPHELNNLAASPEHAETVQRLLKELKDWQKKTGDKQPLKAGKRRPMKIDLTGRRRKPDRHQPKWIRDKYFQDR